MQAIRKYACNKEIPVKNYFRVLISTTFEYDFFDHLGHANTPRSAFDNLLIMKHIIGNYRTDRNTFMFNKEKKRKKTHCNLLLKTTKS